MKTGSIGNGGDGRDLHPARGEDTGPPNDDTTGGNAGVEPRMGAIFTESVVQRG